MITTAITVLMPVYNAEKYLADAIGSILNQSFENFELLIINDGSTDGSEKIILSYSDQRIRYVKNEKNIKLIATLNKGIEISKGKYIARMDADDVSSPNRLQVQFDFMESNPSVALCGSWFELIGDRTGIAKYVASHNEIMMKMLCQCHFCHPTIIMRKSMIETFETKFDPTFIHAEDYDFFSRIGEKYKLGNIQTALLKYRIHEQSVSASNRDVQINNSTVIKKRTFKNIGVVVDEEDIDLFKTIMQHEYTTTVEYLNKSELLLGKLLAANKLSACFEGNFFETYIAQLWFNTAYNSGSLGLEAFNKFFNSPISKHKKLTAFVKIKFFIKMFLKR